MPEARLNRTREASDRLPAEVRVDIEERAASMEYDGGLSREDAEEAALVSVAAVDLRG